ncbi:MAG: hypothetical protein ABFS42_10945 [Candidatus Krumholzibacteriota bacterium]
MKTLFTFLLMIFLVGSAVAVVDPDPNSLGIYFDLNADVTYLDVAPDTEFRAYVILTNPTFGFVKGIEFGYESVVPAGMEGMLFRLATIIPPHECCPIFPYFLKGDYIFGLTPPLPTSAATVLVEWLFMTLAPMTIEYHLGPSSAPSLPDGFPVVMNENDELISLGISSGDVTVPVAEVNTGHQPVVAESATWGGVKSLYR